MFYNDLIDSVKFFFIFLLGLWCVWAGHIAAYGWN